MILVDVYVPVINHTYNFRLDENAMVMNIIEEITEMISQKEQSNIQGDYNDLMLCYVKDQVILEKELSLYNNRIQTGSTLMLI